MAYFPNNIVADVERVARVYYIDRNTAWSWNTKSRGDELRLLTGWCWSSKDGREHEQGLKTQSAAIRAAWYRLCAHREAPFLARPRLRVVAKREVTNAAA